MRKGEEVIESGDLNKKMRFYRRTLQRDKIGGHTEVWQRVGVDTFVCLEETNAYEVTVAAQLSQQVSHTITIRYRANINTDMALYYPLENRVFSISGIRKVDSKRRKMSLRTMERRDLDTRGW